MNSTHTLVIYRKKTVFKLKLKKKIRKLNDLESKYQIELKNV